MKVQKSRAAGYQVYRLSRSNYLVISPNGEEYKVDHLKEFCKLHDLPLSAMCKALKTNGIVKTPETPLRHRKSKVEGYQVFYLD